MRDLWVVASYTIKDMLTKKSFLISNLIILIIIVVGFNIPNIMSNFNSNGSTTNVTKELIVDAENIYEGTLTSLNSLDLGYEFIIENKEMSFDEIKEKIESGEVEDAVVISRQGDNIQMTYIVEDATMMNGVPKSLQNIFTQLYTDLQLSKLDLSQEELNSLKPNFEFTLEQTSEEEVKGNVLVIMILSLILFYAIYFCAYQVSTSITTEKTSKIMETLVTSTKPRTIVLGKTVGIGIVGFIQVAVMVLVALICAKFCLP